MMPTYTVDYHGAGPRIELDDVVLGRGKVYVCTGTRPVESRLWPERWRVELRVLGRRDEHTRELVGAQLAGRSWRRHVHELGEPYQRGERPTDHPCDDPRCAGCTLGPDPAGAAL